MESVSPPLPLPYFPPELWHKITTFVDKESLKNMSHVSRSMYFLVQEDLYRSVTVYRPTLEELHESKEIGKTKNKNTYLLDCEYISELDKYYIFDALISENKNITSLSLVKRLSLIPMLCSQSK